MDSAEEAYIEVSIVLIIRNLFTSGKWSFQFNPFLLSLSQLLWDEGKNICNLP